MQDFNGFPPGDLKFSPIPDLVFSRLLPLLDDLATVKVILHVLWLRQRDSKQAVSLAELQSDETIIHGLAQLGDDPYEALKHGLDQAVAVKALIYAQLENDDGRHDLYFLNSEGGRLMLEKMESGEVGIVAVSGMDVVSPPKNRHQNIFDLYEANIGLLSPILADELKDAEMTYPYEWIEDAFKIAVENNVRKWRYIRAILERMATEGRENAITERSSQKDSSKRWFTDEEYEHLIEH